MSKPRCREQVKSHEEWAMVQWLHDAVRVYLVENWEYEPKEFVLFDRKTYQVEKKMKTKVKIVEKALHQPATYTPDFYICFSDLGLELLSEFFEKALVGENKRSVYIDSKGSFNPYQNDQRYFSLVQKAMLERHGIWSQKVVPFEKRVRGSLFLQTFAPDAMRWLKNGKGLNACGMACVGAEEFAKKGSEK